MKTLDTARLARAHEWVDAAYRQLERQKGFVARAAQISLSKAVALSFIDGSPLAAEAPTGTGKTLAYLLGALASSESSLLPNKEPVVVSTATKALQQQLVTNDLPKLAAAGLIKLDQVAVAKGKGNYLCLKHAEETALLLERAQSDPELFLDEQAERMDADELTGMVDAYVSGSWNGDFDHYEGPRPKSVRSIAVSSDTCMRKKCENYNSCAYYKARAQMAGCQILVANHDLLLLDLWLTSTGVEGTLPVANYLVVFDEAHHLPEKAIQVGSSEALLSLLTFALPKLAGLQKILKGSPELTKLAAANHLRVEDFDRTAVATALKDLSGILSLLDVDEDSGQRRFARGVLPEAVVDGIKRLQSPLSELVLRLNTMGALLRETQSLPGPLAEKASELLRRALDVKQPGEEALRCFEALLSPRRHAKWLFRKDTSVALHCAPLEGADVLQKLLWTNPRCSSVVMVSATLRDLGGFERFKRRSGLPGTARFEVLPYTFPYGDSRLVVAGMNATPKPVDRKMFIPELGLKLPKSIDAKEGTLILFPSWSMLRDFAPKLKSRFGASTVKVQGEHTVKMLVRDHCAAIDRGEGSILAGVATMSEGLDLPGKYCTHVAIVALPFAVPTEPVEQELSDLLGSKYFSERSLPDAMVRLTQMVGRLLRRESDRGRVTVFDRRLASTSYGRQMLDNLPPFQKVVEPVESV